MLKLNDVVPYDDFKEAIKLACQEEFYDSETNLKLGKRRLYRTLSKVLLMPDYRSRCLTLEYLKIVSLVESSFKVTLDE
jgi:hypothetical protein